MDWRRPIIFEGVELPPEAIAIDHLGMYDNLPGISAEASEWLWQFCICVGRPRTEQSDIIRRHAIETLELVNRNRSELPARVARQFDESFEDSIIETWIESLETMIEIGATTNECTWEAPLQPGEPNYGRPWEDIEAEMMSGLDKAIAKAQRKPWWKRLFS